MKERTKRGKVKMKFPKELYRIKIPKIDNFKKGCNFQQNENPNQILFSEKDRGISF